MVLEIYENSLGYTAQCKKSLPLRFREFYLFQSTAFKTHLVYTDNTHTMLPKDMN